MGAGAPVAAALLERPAMGQGNALPLAALDRAQGSSVVVTGVVTPVVRVRMAPAALSPGNVWW